MGIKIYKRANDKSGSEKGGKQKWNAGNVFVKVDNEYVSLADLAKAARDNDFVPLPQQVENEMEMDGEQLNISDLVANWKRNKKKEMAKEDDEEDDDSRENEGEPQKGGGTPKVQTSEVDAEAEDNPDEVLEKAKKNARVQIKKLRNALDAAVESGNDDAIMIANRKLQKAKKAYNSLYGGEDNSDAGDPALKAAKAGMPKINKKKKNKDMEEDEEEEEDGRENADEDEDGERENDKSEEDETEENIERSGNNKKNSRDKKHFLRLNEIREEGHISHQLNIDTMGSRVDRGRNKYGTGK